MDGIEEKDIKRVARDTEIRVLIGDGIGLGLVAMMIANCPIAEVLVKPAIDEEPEVRELRPAFKMSSHQAMEIGMNLIYFAKLALDQERQTREGM